MDQPQQTPPAPDAYHGKGGRYVRDPVTGERRPADPPPDAPPGKAIKAAPRRNPEPA